MAVSRLAGLEYHGHPGGTAECVRAVERLLHHTQEIERARILTGTEHGASHPSHALVLTDRIGDLIVVKAGFASGYGGQGPRGLSYCLGLLHWHGVEIDEVEVDSSLLERVNRSALTMRDLTTITDPCPIPPTRFWDYVSESDYTRSVTRNPWAARSNVMPLAIIDDRLADLVKLFWTDADSALSKGHRRLETIVRDRIGAEVGGGLVGQKLFTKAFNGPEACLIWPEIDSGEAQGRANLFTGAALAFRNPRAHRESRDSQFLLSEFLLLNLLFCLEEEAIAMPGQTKQ